MNLVHQRLMQRSFSFPGLLSPSLWSFTYSSHKYVSLMLETHWGPLVFKYIKTRDHHLKKPLASPTQWTWVWVYSGSWWCTGRPGMLQSMWSQRVRHDWATELNWILHMLRAGARLIHLCNNINKLITQNNFLKSTLKKYFNIRSRLLMQLKKRRMKFIVIAASWGHSQKYFSISQLKVKVKSTNRRKYHWQTHKTLVVFHLEILGII